MTNQKQNQNKTMNNNTIRNVFMTLNNKLIPLITIFQDKHKSIILFTKYTTIILFTLFIIENIFIQAADKLGDIIKTAVYKLRREIATNTAQIEKQEKQVKALNNQLTQQAEQLKAHNEQLEKQKTK